MNFTTSPCEWPLNYVGCSDEPFPESFPVSGIPFVEQMAVEYLWRWTGKRFGVCEVEVSPCRTDCSNAQNGSSTYFETPGGGFAWEPQLIAGEWLNLSCGYCRGDCSCSRVFSIALPGPVAEISGIWIDGELLPPSAYVMQGVNRLTRIDDEGWPTCSQPGVPIDSPGTWGIRYKMGVPVPTSGQVAAARLAVEFSKAMCGDSSCQLPQRLQSISRQGVTVAVLDSFDDIDTGHTGIWIVDQWVASVMKPNVRSQVMSPDLRSRKSRRI